MFKRFFLIFFTLLGSFILLITVYRASVGIGALNMSAVVRLIGNSFTRTSAHLDETLDHLNKAVDGIVKVSNYELVGDSGLNKLLDGILIFGRFLVGNGTLDILIYFCVLVEKLVKLVVILIQDFGDMIRLLGFFIISGSPYPVNPYFPVG